jgi:single-strand DNA-binding protein
MVNKVMLIGRVGAKPTLKEGKSGKKYCSFSMVTDSGFGDKKVSDWHSIMCFEKLAEIAEKYLDKGSKVFVEGRISYDTYEKDGKKQKSVKIIANDMTLLDGKSSKQVVSEQQQQDESHEVFPEFPEDSNQFAGSVDELGDIPF